MRSALLAIMIGLVAAATHVAGAEETSSRPPVDDARAKSEGIRKLTGKHLTLYTDVPSSPAVDALPAIFDEAVPQWAEYFGVDPARADTLRARGFLIADRRRFDALGLMPKGNGTFINGISVGSDFWFYDQPTAYYRRHLMLHEGTHVFMVTMLGGCGPGWYMEGTAELMGTHAYDERYNRLTLRTMPQSREEVPMWGRIKLIDDARATQRALALPAVMRIDNRKQLGNEAYAWCWTAAKLLDTHPRYRDRFRKLREYVSDPDFHDRFQQLFRDDWDNLQAEWQAYIATLDFGYNFERMAIDFERGAPLTAPQKVTIAADRGWQSSGALLQAGKKYRITAIGRYEIANDGAAWPCEPGGVTLDYHDGRPLGMLLGAIDGRTHGATLADTIAIGLETTVTPAADGTLYLRVNDSPGKLNDNRGTLSVTISPSG